MSDILRCYKCQRDLPADDFTTGSPRRCRECRAIYSAASRERTRKRTHKAKDVPCMDCGIRYPPAAMDFDHVRGKKLFGLNEAHNRAIQSVKDEMAKCDVVCANCHRIRTYKRRQHVPRPRGTRLAPKTQTPSLPDTLTLFD
jgi:hypothetical protein